MRRRSIKASILAAAFSSSESKNSRAGSRPFGNSTYSILNSPFTSFRLSHYCDIRVNDGKSCPAWRLNLRVTIAERDILVRSGRVMPSPLADKNAVLDAIRQAAQTLGHSPSRAEFKAKSGMTEYQVLQHFPSWREAVRAAGLEPDSTNVKLDDETLLEDWGNGAAGPSNSDARPLPTRGKIQPRRIRKALRAVIRDSVKIQRIRPGQDTMGRRSGIVASGHG